MTVQSTLLKKSTDLQLKVGAGVATFLTPVLAMADATKKTAVEKLASKQGIELDGELAWGGQGGLIDSVQTEAEKLFDLMAIVFLVVGFVITASGLVTIYSRSKRDQPTGGAWIAVAIGVAIGLISTGYLVIVGRSVKSLKGGK
ncbi:hypothetical protein ACFBZI_11410 [Moraxella sp. ZJ142]|uniref:hypothetical protein n=1 Tax=Moraxella marmotae TaxID=3344520 RepID=UPI0035D51097